MTKNIEKSLELSDRTRDVNDLLVRAFGEGVAGNYVREKKKFRKRGKLIPSKSLGIVVKRSISGKKEIGRFFNPDGSKLIISKKGFMGSYRFGAEKFSRLYREKFPKESLIVRYNGEYI